MGWVANALVLCSIYQVAHKRRNGFLFGAVGTGLWIIHAWGQWDLVSMQSMIFVMQLWAWKKWT